MVEAKQAALARPARLSWRRLLVVVAVVEVVLLAVMVVARGDLLALALAAIIGVGLGLWLGRDRLPARRWLGTGLPGLIVLGLVFADIAAYTVTGALSNLLSREALLDLATPAALAVLSLVGLAATAGAGWTREDPGAGSRAAGWTAGMGLLAFAAMLVVGAAGGTRAPQAPAPSALTLNTVNMAYSATELRAQAGVITLRLSNSDLFWHTFTVDALGVNVQAPVGGEREVVFTAAPGVYAFYCAIPGHALIGMTGTLTVE
jgi:plastocyanin